jgi:hypothetical protein
MDHSVLFIWNLDQYFTSSLQYQRDISLKFLSNFLFGNKSAVGLMKKMFGKNLFQKVNTSKELFKDLNWE